mmetsp:Transcript_16293/g.32604  ORF Transcript_16293/g.32604 Transcript_16293/m.32604 type:complete len:214 (-) Transcript_16293:561-1202(-)
MCCNLGKDGSKPARLCAPSASSSFACKFNVSKSSKMPPPQPPSSRCLPVSTTRFSDSTIPPLSLLSLKSSNRSPEHTVACAFRRARSSLSKPVHKTSASSFVKSFPPMSRCCNFKRDGSKNASLCAPLLRRRFFCKINVSMQLLHLFKPVASSISTFALFPPMLCPMFRCLNSALQSKPPRDFAPRVPRLLPQRSICFRTLVRSRALHICCTP